MPACKHAHNQGRRTDVDKLVAIGDGRGNPLPHTGKGGLILSELTVQHSFSYSEL